MLRTLCKSKIHRATVAGADLNYVGSIPISHVQYVADDEENRVARGALRACGP